MNQTHEAPSAIRMTPPDQTERVAALDPTQSVIVQAPAGSGKTDLLTRRFLRLLSRVDDPGEIVAITFTKAAAAEMRHRILTELEKAADPDRTAISENPSDDLSMECLAAQALEHANQLGWNLLDSPAQLRISTIDSFCRELAIQQPLISGLPGDLNVVDNAAELYRKAARRTLQQIENSSNRVLVAAVKDLLEWRDNNWNDVENQLVSMLEKRDRWMQDFVLRSDHDWEDLRIRLEAPFARALSGGLHSLTSVLTSYPHACAEAHFLARFACEQNGAHRELAELADFPCGPFETPDELDFARSAFSCLANMLLTGSGQFRAKVDKSIGFPASSRSENDRMRALIEDLKHVPGLREALRAVEELPPARYTEDEWRIVRACFTLLRHAAGELRIVFEEAGAVDFAEIAQRAQLILEGQDGYPTEAGFSVANRIRHLLVDEFQDTSRRQHKLVTSLVKAWPDTSDRTVFVVGDPMQSIYFFRDAEAELFQRVRSHGLELDLNDRLAMLPVTLAANFRTAAQLVEQNNVHFQQVFQQRDGSGIAFSPSMPARTDPVWGQRAFALHLDFMPEVLRSSDPNAADKQEAMLAREQAHARQIAEIIRIIREHEERMDKARAEGGKCRIAILARTKNALAPIASALREEQIVFRAVELENLADRPEVRDVLALARAVSNPEDRVAWLSVLRAPWCGLRTDELHALVSADDEQLLKRTVPELVDERCHLLQEPSRSNVQRVRAGWAEASHLSKQNPSMTLGTRLRAVWQSLGGENCVDAAAAENLQVLWNLLDSLPNREVDLVGQGIHSRLVNMTAQADPEANNVTGVQLMTIHKSKGLEFEVVIVPELQAGCGQPELGMLSWLERGVVESADGEGPTEFLIAPRQSKGAERGSAKAWVDSMRRARERQEMRRVLYVASTRAREELHLFARPEYSRDAELISARAGSLLDTAWNAIGATIQREFTSWSAERLRNTLQLAAEAKIIEMPHRSENANRSLLLRPGANATLPPATNRDRTWPAQAVARQNRYERHKGDIPSRALGTGVHMLLEEAARLRVTSEWPEVKRELERLLPKMTAGIRAAGLWPAEAERIANQAFAIANAVLDDDNGNWILSRHSDAASEVAWTDWTSGMPRVVRADRVFRAGEAPLEQGDRVWWIIDYKTAHLELLPESIIEKRSVFGEQLNHYAGVLKAMQGEHVRIHAGLYYPRLRLFDWWAI